MVLFITDGKPTIGETSENALVQQVQSANTGHTRIFTFGIGDEINTHLLDKLVAQTQAWRTYVTADEDIEIKISDLYTKLQSPVLTGLSLDFGGGVEVRQMYPKPLPDLFRGSSITILGRYSGNGAVSATLKGTLKGKEYRSTYHAEFASKGEAHSFIPSLWAARRVGYLLDQIRLNGEDKELVDEVTLLARKHGIITPYTSYLILEDETDKVATRRIPQDQTTLSAVMAPRKAELTERTRAEYKKFASEKSGAAAGISTEVQSLQMSKNADQIQQGQSRLSYKDDAGAERNVTQQVRTVQGRAFYDTGRRWVDAMAQAQKNARIAKIKYASPEYFTLIRGNAAAAQYAALGRNVTFVMNGAVYEVSE
jgi:Ca-activated chloride channel family protein